MNDNIFIKKHFKKSCITIFCLYVILASLLFFSCEPVPTIPPEPEDSTETEEAAEEYVPEDTQAVEEEMPAQEETPEGDVVEDETEKEAEEQTGGEEITINVYYSDPMAEYLVPESRIISSENKYVDALHELMKKPVDETLTPLMPDTTTVNSVTVEDGNAKVDLSQEFLDDRFVSDTVDILLLYSIVNTLTQFPEVNSVTLYIDGEKLDILGQLDVKDPVFRRSDLIKDG